MDRTVKKHTYDQILKSTTLVGGSSFINILIGMIRSKAMAAFLGPAGFGLAGLYGSVANLTQSIAGMGVNSSGVRQIAESVGSGAAERVNQTATVLRRTSIVLGTLGCLFLLVFARQVSVLTFGSPSHAVGVSLLSMAVLLNLVAAGQGALIQGMRRIADLAKMNVLGAFLGTLVTIILVTIIAKMVLCHRWSELPPQPYLPPGGTAAKFIAASTDGSVPSRPRSGRSPQTGGRFHVNRLDDRSERICRANSGSSPTGSCRNRTVPIGMDARGALYRVHPASHGG